MVAADRAKIGRLAEEGDRRARSAVAALKTLSFQLSGAQLGITITSLIVGFLIEPIVAPAIEPLLETLGIPERSSLGVAIAVSLAVATVLEMVVAELFPKNLAIAKPVDLGLAIAGPLRLYNRLFKPVILFLNAAANATVRLFGVTPREELIGVRSLDELQMLIYSSREHGTLREEEFALLTRSISFRNKTAADALVPRRQVSAIGDQETISDLARLARKTGHSRFPVLGQDLDDIVGIAHVLDIYRIPFEDRDRTPVSEIMGPAVIVPESMTLDELLTRLRREHQQLAVIVDEYGGTAGVVTLEDLLEEIVGDIQDEYDRDMTQAGPTSPVEGVHRISGMLHPDEILDLTGFEMPEGDYETLAGFLLTLFDRIPSKGAQTTYKGWEFKVTDMDRNRIAEVLMCAPPRSESIGSDR